MFPGLGWKLRDSFETHRSETCRKCHRDRRSPSWTKKAPSTNHPPTVTCSRMIGCWWLNQPNWKICASQIGSWNPRDRGENNKYLSCHHLDDPNPFDIPWNPRFMTGSLLSGIWNNPGNISSTYMQQLSGVNWSLLTLLKRGFLGWNNVNLTKPGRICHPLRNTNIQSSFWPASSV